MATGKSATCEWFDSRKGYGFIKCAQSSESIFVHQSSIQADGFRKLTEGQACTYELSTDAKDRMKATNVIPGEQGSGPKRRRRRGGKRETPKEE